MSVMFMTLDVPATFNEISIYTQHFFIGGNLMVSATLLTRVEVKLCPSVSLSLCVIGLAAVAAPSACLGHMWGRRCELLVSLLILKS